jgi:mutator protein MutT
VSQNPVRVVAAVIERNGRILIGQRRSTDRHPYKWEFPGGKVELNEAPEEALKRELREELAIEAEIGPEMARYQVQYGSSRPLELLFYRVRRFEGEPQNLSFEQIRWDRPNRLTGYDFLEGDIAFVKRLAEGSAIEVDPV